MPRALGIVFKLKKPYGLLACQRLQMGLDDVRYPSTEAGIKSRYECYIAQLLVQNFLGQIQYKVAYHLRY